MTTKHMPDKRIIVVAGKGGVGKTTVTALLIDALTRVGVEGMLVVDSDPAVTLHYSLLGLDRPPGTPLASVIDEIDLSARAIRALDVPLNKHILRVLNGASVITRHQLHGRYFDYMVMGKSNRAGCFCQPNRILGEMLNHLTQYPLTIIDSEAGLEHLSRKRTDTIDLFILVALPNRPSLAVAKEALETAAQVGIKLENTVMILNRTLPGFDPTGLVVPNNLVLTTYLPDASSQSIADNRGGWHRQTGWFRSPQNCPAPINTVNIADDFRNRTCLRTIHFVFQKEIKKIKYTYN